MAEEYMPPRTRSEIHTEMMITYVLAMIAHRRSALESEEYMRMKKVGTHSQLELDMQGRKYNYWRDEAIRRSQKVQMLAAILPHLLPATKR